VDYLTKPHVLRAPKASKDFKLYISAQHKVIGSTLMQEDIGKVFAIAYVSRRLLDVETRYGFLEKLCLSLYYVCTKFRPYILSNTCTVVSQHDVIKHVPHKPILSGWVGKSIYSLVEYNLEFELLRAMKR
jgi:hypothetical protein